MTYAVWSFAGIELMALILPAFFCFKSPHHFVVCMRSFLNANYVTDINHVNAQREKQSLRFSIYFSIVFLMSGLNIEFIL